MRGRNVRGRNVRGRDVRGRDVRGRNVRGRDVRGRDVPMLPAVTYDTHARAELRLHHRNREAYADARAGVGTFGNHS